jgi:aspartate-semialdehyde dehydrogenase
VVGNVLPLGNTEEDTNNKIRDEVCLVLDEPELKISVTAQRVFVKQGHYVDLRIKFKGTGPVSPQDVQHKLEAYAPLKDWEGSLPDAPKQPIRVSLDKKWPRPVQATAQGKREDGGMSVHVGHISTTDRVFDVTLSLVVDNVARGAFGAALLTAQVHREMVRRSKELL